MGQKVWRDKGFDACDAMHLFFRNADVNRHNEGMLMQLNSPIAKINAENKGKAKQVKAKDAMNLENSLYLAVGANVI